MTGVPPPSGAREGWGSGQAHPCHEPKRGFGLPRRPPAHDTNRRGAAARATARAQCGVAQRTMSRAGKTSFTLTRAQSTVVRAAGWSGRGNAGTAMCSARTFSSDAPQFQTLPPMDTVGAEIPPVIGDISINNRYPEGVRSSFNHDVLIADVNVLQTSVNEAVCIRIPLPLRNDCSRVLYCSLLLVCV